MHVLVVIPARFGSARLPGKPLRKIAGHPLIRLVAARVLELDLGAEVVVATDDERVTEAVLPLGVSAVMTDRAHRSGTERIAEVLRRPGYDAAEIVVNVQGDELFVEREVVLGALGRIDDGFSIGTAAGPLLPTHVSDPNRVKVAVDDYGRAVWFSRSDNGAGSALEGLSGVYLHVGVYAYSRDAILRWVKLPESSAGRAEGLEQLRPMEHGMEIGVAVTHERVEPGIDTEADLYRARTRINLIGINA